MSAPELEPIRIDSSRWTGSDAVEQSDDINDEEGFNWTHSRSYLWFAICPAALLAVVAWALITGYIPGFNEGPGVLLEEQPDLFWAKLEYLVGTAVIVSLMMLLTAWLLEKGRPFQLRAWRLRQAVIRRRRRRQAKMREARER